jgi:hypothetical protein
MRSKWFLAALLLCTLLAVLNEWAQSDSLYWKWIWFDIPMHFLGGLSTSAFVIAFFGKHRPRLFILSMICVFVGWELFEYLFKLPQPANYPLDTAKDLVMDTLGAILAYVSARKTIWKKV